MVNSTAKPSSRLFWRGAEQSRGPSPLMLAGGSGMGILGWVLVVLSGLAMFVFGIQILIMAFKTSVGWGLACLFLPFAALVFVIKFWDQAKTPFLRSLACL